MTEREGSSWEKKERRRGRNVELDQFSKSSLSTPTIKERRSFSLISSVPLSHSRITPIYPPAVKAIESRARRRLLLLLLPPSTSPSTSRLLLSVSHLFSFLSVTYQTHRLGTSFGVFRRYSNTQLDQNTAQKEVVGFELPRPGLESTSVSSSSCSASAALRDLVIRSSGRRWLGI